MGSSICNMMFRLFAVVWSLSTIDGVTSSSSFYDGQTTPMETIPIGTSFIVNKKIRSNCNDESGYCENDRTLLHNAVLTMLVELEETTFQQLPLGGEGEEEEDELEEERRHGQQHQGGGVDDRRGLRRLVRTTRQRRRTTLTSSSWGTVAVLDPSSVSITNDVICPRYETLQFLNSYCRIINVQYNVLLYQHPDTTIATAALDSITQRYTDGTRRAYNNGLLQSALDVFYPNGGISNSGIRDHRQMTIVGELIAFEKTHRILEEYEFVVPIITHVIVVSSEDNPKDSDDVMSDAFATVVIDEIISRERPTDANQNVRVTLLAEKDDSSSSEDWEDYSPHLDDFVPCQSFDTSYVHCQSAAVVFGILIEILPDNDSFTESTHVQTAVIENIKDRYEMATQKAMNDGTFHDALLKHPDNTDFSILVLDSSSGLVRAPNRFDYLPNRGAKDNGKVKEEKAITPPTPPPISPSTLPPPPTKKSWYNEFNWYWIVAGAVLGLIVGVFLYLITHRGPFAGGNHNNYNENDDDSSRIYDDADDDVPKYLKNDKSHSSINDSTHGETEWDYDSRSSLKR